MANRYASGRNSRAMCDRCGFVYKLPQLKYEYVHGKKTNVKTCPTCWDLDHPQNFLPEAIRALGADPQVVRDPRPDPEAVGYPVSLTPATVQHGTSPVVYAVGIFPGYSASATAPAGISVQSIYLISPTRVRLSLSVDGSVAPGEYQIKINNLTAILTVS